MLCHKSENFQSSTYPLAACLAILVFLTKDCVTADFLLCLLKLLLQSQPKHHDCESYY